MSVAPTIALRETVSLELLVPLTDNDGIPFSDADFAAFEHEIARRTGGITRRGDVEGVWVTPAGTLQRERSRSYVTTVPVTAAADVIADLETLIRESFRQLAAFIQATPTRATAF